MEVFCRFLIIICIFHLMLRAEQQIKRQKSTQNSDSIKCDIVMRYSEGYGIGLYAGKTFRKGVHLEYSIGMYVPHYITFWNEMDQYVEGYNETHHHLMLGYAIIYNHAPKEKQMAAKSRSYDGWVYGDKSHSVDTIGVAMQTIQKGSQIFSFYDTEWFTLRNLQAIDPFSLQETYPDVIRVADIHNDRGRIPGCGSKFTEIKKILHSTTKQLMSSELVAKVNILKGTIIEVTRALLLSEGDHLAKEPLNSYLWWKQGYNQRKYPYELRDKHLVRVVNTPYNHSGSYALLHSGNGGLYHGYEYSKTEINVDYNWWDLSEINATSESFYWHNVNNPTGDFLNPINNTLISSLNTESVDVDSIGNMESFSTDSVQVNQTRRKLRRTKAGYVCCTRMLVAFTANKDITKGEKLVINLKKYQGNRFAASKFANQCM